MVTEVDHNAIKKRIQTILKANSSLYDNKIPTKTGNRVNEVYVGLPDGYVWESLPMPYISITNDLNYETDKPFGSVVGAPPTAAYSTSYHIVNYLVIIMVAGSSAAVVEQQLDAFHKTVKETLKANFQFINTTNNQNDLGIEQTILTQSKFVDGGSRKGKTVNGVIITCQVKLVTG
ncbi:MAG TPA: hypothetical protein VM577_02805 [Anaerovoracaceae bacterium]|nr:hypothetical protein [Anaerovoracaceae bacterium]